jgi:type I restriction enzyme, S subunit
VLFAWSGSLMIDFWTNGRGALNQHLFKVSSEVFSKWFYYFWTKFHLDEFISIAESKATTMGHIQRKHLSDAKVLVPSDIQMQGFSKVFEPIIDQIVINRIEVNSLIELREALLPKTHLRPA